jgi:hypothetical protein
VRSRTTCIRRSTSPNRCPARVYERDCESSVFAVASAWMRPSIRSHIGRPSAQCARRWEETVKLPRRHFLHLAAGAAALPAVSRIARAQTYPTRPLRLVVPFAPAGTTAPRGSITSSCPHEPLVSYRINRHLRVESSSIDDSRLRGALPAPDIRHRAKMRPIPCRRDPCTGPIQKSDQRYSQLDAVGSLQRSASTGNHQPLPYCEVGHRQARIGLSDSLGCRESNSATPLAGRCWIARLQLVNANHQTLDQGGRQLRDPVSDCPQQPSLRPPSPVPHLQGATHPARWSRHTRDWSPTAFILA